MKKTDINLILSLLYMLWLSACENPGDAYTVLHRRADIYPDCRGAVIPYNIAPPNFLVREEGRSHLARIAVAGKDSFDVRFKSALNIPLRKWRNLLAENRGERLTITVFSRQSSGWVKYSPLALAIAAEPIDPYMAYRLIEPGYEAWGAMGIYQRRLENFEETPIMLNSLTDNNCMNCHSFCRHRPDRMLFHMRQKHAGTVFTDGGKAVKINTSASPEATAGVYPRWHPGGRYVAFSSNTTRQGFHTAHPNKIEVYDTKSDLFIYDVQTNTVFTDRLISSEDYFETFPEWSPDGLYLYFCSAAARAMPALYDSLRYGLLRIPFDPATGSFGKQADTLVSASATGKSVALPRVSPDNRYVVYCMSDYGTFPVWHRESDLYRLDLNDGRITRLDSINSAESESYHSWSSNGRWMVFGSRRLDGVFTRPYICYFDAEGNAHTPFLLPQQHPLHYDCSLKSYNIPEFISGKVEISPRELSAAARGEAMQATDRRRRP
ncbi:MAG: hypothetical protein LBR08_11680 [Bacteroidales bacterium]|jgi:hypothetical protein|nr:hypothetical protein [Bacteroidales bacterium]